LRVAGGILLGVGPFAAFLVFEELVGYAGNQGIERQGFTYERIGHGRLPQKAVVG
jgi:hypothetical protein